MDTNVLTRLALSSGSKVRSPTKRRKKDKKKEEKERDRRHTVPRWPSFSLSLIIFFMYVYYACICLRSYHFIGVHTVPVTVWACQGSSFSTRRFLLVFIRCVLSLCLSVSIYRTIYGWFPLWCMYSRMCCIRGCSYFSILISSYLSPSSICYTQVYIHLRYTHAASFLPITSFPLQVSHHLPGEFHSMFHLPVYRYLSTSLQSIYVDLSASLSLSGCTPASVSLPLCISIFIVLVMILLGIASVFFYLVSLFSLGKNGEKGLAVCDLAKEGDGKWKILVLNFMRIDNKPSIVQSQTTDSNRSGRSDISSHSYIYESTYTRRVQKGREREREEDSPFFCIDGSTLSSFFLPERNTQTHE